MKPAVILALLPLTAGAQVYKCETPQGVVFSDRECGDKAEVVEVKDTSGGVGVPLSDELLNDLQVKKAERAQRRYIDSLYDERDKQIAQIDRQIAALKRERATANNNLAGATYMAGIDKRLGDLHSARANVAASYQATIVDAQLEKGVQK